MGRSILLLSAKSIRRVLNFHVIQVLPHCFFFLWCPFFQTSRWSQSFLSKGYLETLCSGFITPSFPNACSVACLIGFYVVSLVISSDFLQESSGSLKVSLPLSVTRPPLATVLIIIIPKQVTICSLLSLFMQTKVFVFWHQNNDRSYNHCVDPVIHLWWESLGSYCLTASS